jgi:hypothetical protein
MVIFANREVMIEIGSIVANRTLCGLFGVASMGGIRVSKKGNLIVLVSNNTDPTYSNEWKDDVLHFIGMGSAGPQKLDRQNRTLANAKRAGMTLHLFEVFEKGRYVYVGEVEPAGEAYRSDQPDRRAEDRFVWVFPLRKKALFADNPSHPPEASSADYLPYGAYAVIGADLSANQVEFVDEMLNRLKEAGVAVFDQRDVDRRRYEKAMGDWWERVLVQARSIVKERIKELRRRGRSVGFTDDELNVNAWSTEADLREVMQLCFGGDDPSTMEELFEEARRRVPMPEAPKAVTDAAQVGAMEAPARPALRTGPIDRSRFDAFK